MTEDEQILQKFSLDLPKDLHRKLKQYCLNNEKTMKEVFLEAVENMIKE
jgi:hypothetical protein